MTARSLLAALAALPDEASVPVGWVREKIADDKELAVQIDHTLQEVG